MAIICVMFMTRPKLVSTISAPARCASSATAKAMLRRSRTPVMSSFFPSSSMGRKE